MITKEELAKRYPPRSRFEKPQHARGMDATEFVARYGEITARVEPPEQGKSDARDHGQES